MKSCIVPIAALLFANAAQAASAYDAISEAMLAASDGHGVVPADRDLDPDSAKRDHTENCKADGTRGCDSRAAAALYKAVPDITLETLMRTAEQACSSAGGKLSFRPFSKPTPTPARAKERDLSREEAILRKRNRQDFGYHGICRVDGEADTLIIMTQVSAGNGDDEYKIYINDISQNN